MTGKFNAIIAKSVPPTLVVIALLVAIVTFGAREPVPAGLHLICLLLIAAGFLAQIDAFLERRK